MSGVDPINYDVGELRDLARRTEHEGGPASDRSDGDSGGVDGADEGPAGSDAAAPGDREQGGDGAAARSPDEWDWGQTEAADADSAAVEPEGAVPAAPRPDADGDPGDGPAEARSPESFEWVTPEESDPSTPQDRRADVASSGPPTGPTGEPRPDARRDGPDDGRDEGATADRRSGTEAPDRSGDGSDTGPGRVDDDDGGSVVEDVGPVVEGIRDTIARFRADRADAGTGEEATAAPDEFEASGAATAGSRSATGTATRTSESGDREARAEPQSDEHGELTGDDWTPWSDDDPAVTPGERSSHGRSPGRSSGGLAGDSAGDGDGGDASLSSAVAAALEEGPIASGDADRDLAEEGLGEKPFLAYIPEEREDVVEVWLEFLVRRAGTDGALAAIEAYSDAEWITVGVAVDLQSRVETRPDEPGEYAALNRSDHLRSLEYIYNIT